MRYCPTCSHIFEDDSVKFCPNDGRALVDEAAVSQASSGQPLQSFAPAPAAPIADSEEFDPEVTLSRGQPGIQETMFPSESLNEVLPEVDSAAASDQPGTDGKPLESNVSAPAAPAEKSDPAEPRVPPKLTPSQPKAQANLQKKTKPGRRQRLALLLIVVLAVLLIPPVGGFFWWRQFKSSPAYQLALLFDAVHRNDNATVDQIVAMDSISDAFASQVTQNVLSQNTSAATDSERKQLESSVTGRTSNIKQTVREEVEKQVKDEAALSTGKSFLRIALATYYKGGIKQTGDTATVAPQAHPVAWTMQRSGDHWTIVAVKDDALASRIQEQITSELPATGNRKTRSDATRQKNSVASAQQNDPAQQKNSTDSSRNKKKARKKAEKGFRIDLPFPELHIELKPASRN